MKCHIDLATARYYIDFRLRFLSRALITSHVAVAWKSCALASRVPVPHDMVLR
jgi:hypothetical protein